MVIPKQMTRKGSLGVTKQSFYRCKGRTVRKGARWFGRGWFPKTTSTLKRKGVKD